MSEPFAKISTKGLGKLSRERRALLALRLKSKEGRDRLRLAPRGDRIPLSYGQERMWFLDQLNPGSPAYNVPEAVRLIGQLDYRALSRSFTHLIRRHEILRTTIAAERGVPRQVIDDPVAPHIPMIDLSQIEQPRAAAGLIVMQEADLGFNLEAGPLIRIRLIKLSADEHILVLVMSHIICDGWSMGILIREMSQLY